MVRGYLGVLGLALLACIARAALVLPSRSASLLQLAVVRVGSLGDLAELRAHAQAVCSLCTHGLGTPLIAYANLFLPGPFEAERGAPQPGHGASPCVRAARGCALPLKVCSHHDAPCAG